MKNPKFHMGMALAVIGLILFIFAEQAVDTYESFSGEVEYDYSDRERINQLREQEY